MGEAQQDITAVNVELIYDALVRPMGKKRLAFAGQPLAITYASRAHL